MRKLLVTGASGFLGWYVCTAARDAGWHVIGVARHHAGELPCGEVRPCDLRDIGEVRRLFSDISPDGVVHLAAVSQPNACEVDPAGAYAVNVAATCEIASLCAERAIPLVFTSTDLVFDGRRAPYSEEDPVCPVSEYGRQKVAAEQTIRERHSRAVICRMPLMFGRAYGKGRSFVQSLVESLRRGERVRLFVDEYRTPLSARDAAGGLLAALERASGRLYHFGGPQRISRYEFGLLLARILGVAESLVVPVRQCDIPMPAPRPADVSLDNSRARRELGFRPRPMPEELRVAVL